MLQDKEVPTNKRRVIMSIRYSKTLLFFVSSLFLFPAFSKPPIESTKVSKELSTMTKLNLNEALAKDILKKVKGIGPKRAEAIVEYRNQHGPFKDLHALSKVKGISKRFVRDNFDSLSSEFSLK